ncbi:hypothetical protein COU56_01625 [Candidatus Pacearchaeota archaeon CG10_big_fil_rev_8_21_14_0_10_31_9]|nr:MAG: hypothetical protein AUJ62_01035 [Candidatus Pacearchaeota archaeon CG1_02_32_21]PIN95430.1 MAG: hypothetical protein COU56_01625 [Candidatus Pacearchaeota archaeon CG10_big_fil_rev_8_21_14_0_10_31_9]PIZ82444.1 MAG: hypothetical protein COX97_04780 [Candidatus Pacearchaeota archaeon CG_4_10_14_0_2_um_filter_05_32_18]
MVQQQPNEDISYELALKLKDLEENNRLTKERILLIGQNLIEFQEHNRKEILEIKKSLYLLESDVKRIKSVVESLSEEISKSARKEELAILHRQYKMFAPLEYVRIQDLDSLLDEKLKKHRERNQEKTETKDEKHFWVGKT